MKGTRLKYNREQKVCRDGLSIERMEEGCFHPSFCSSSKYLLMSCYSVTASVVGTGCEFTLGVNKRESLPSWSLCSLQLPRGSRAQSSMLTFL